MWQVTIYIVYITIFSALQACNSREKCRLSDRIVDLFMGLYLTEVDPLQQPGEFSITNLNGGRIIPVYAGLRPPETLFLQPPIEEPESIVVPVENLDLVSPSITEDEEVAGERVEL